MVKPVPQPGPLPWPLGQRAPYHDRRRVSEAPRNPHV